LLATRNPANNTITPASNVTANARSLPSLPASVPLADNTIVPVAMSTLPIARRRGEIT